MKKIYFPGLRLGVDPENLMPSVRCVGARGDLVSIICLPCSTRAVRSSALRGTEQAAFLANH